MFQYKISSLLYFFKQLNSNELTSVEEFVEELQHLGAVHLGFASAGAGDGQEDLQKVMFGGGVKELLQGLSACRLFQQPFHPPQALLQ